MKAVRALGQRALYGRVETVCFLDDLAGTVDDAPALAGALRRGAGDAVHGGHSHCDGLYSSRAAWRRGSDGALAASAVVYG